MARLYADENVPLPVVDELRALGHDILTIVEDGKGNQRHPDALVLRDATALGRAVVTLNRTDFRRLHADDANHAGIVSCTYDSDFAGQALRIHELLSTQGDMAGRLLQVYRGPVGNSFSVATSQDGARHNAGSVEPAMVC